MADLTPKRMTLSQINGGKTYENGNGIQSRTINDVVQSAAWTQALATNPVDNTEANNWGEASITIQPMPDGTPQFVVKNIKGEMGVGISQVVSQGVDTNGGNKYNVILTDGASAGTIVAPKGGKGDDGNGITVTTINYASGNSGMTPPTAGWSPIIPSVAQGGYLWTRIVFTYEDNTTKTSYSVARQGADGTGFNPNGTYSGVSVGYATTAGTATSASLATSATKLATAQTIDGVSFDGSTNITHYATCSTSASTTVKTVSKTGFILETGARISVKFTYTNTATAPALNVNSTGAKTILFPSSTTSAKNVLTADKIIDFIYDGTNWVMISGDPLDAYPVGAVYISTLSTSPASLFGGSWTVITEGYYLRAINSGASAYADAGLPNIQGNIALRAASDSGTTMALSTSTISPGTSGAFSNTSNTLQQWSGSHSAVTTATKTNPYVQNVDFDASKSSTLYGKSTTVTPQNYGVYMWRRTA